MMGSQTSAGHNGASRFASLQTDTLTILTTAIFIIVRTVWRWALPSSGWVPYHHLCMGLRLLWVSYVKTDLYSATSVTVCGEPTLDNWSPDLHKHQPAPPKTTKMCFGSTLNVCSSRSHCMWPMSSWVFYTRVLVCLNCFGISVSLNPSRFPSFLNRVSKMESQRFEQLFRGYKQKTVQGDARRLTEPVTAASMQRVLIFLGELPISVVCNVQCLSSAQV